MVTVGERSALRYLKKSTTVGPQYCTSSYSCRGQDFRVFSVFRVPSRYFSVCMHSGQHFITVVDVQRMQCETRCWIGVGGLINYCNSSWFTLPPTYAAALFLFRSLAYHHHSKTTISDWSVSRPDGSIYPILTKLRLQLVTLDGPWHPSILCWLPVPRNVHFSARIQ
jgi:hypothetical protein